jgi:hypothetical protein
VLADYTIPQLPNNTGYLLESLDYGYLQQRRFDRRCTKWNQMVGIDWSTLLSIVRRHGTLGVGSKRLDSLSTAGEERDFPLGPAPERRTRPSTYCGLSLDQELMEGYIFWEQTRQN